MSRQVYDFEPPERFVAGTVGEPGDRTFFLQARGGGRVISVALEKIQVTLLADKLEELLAEAARRFDADIPDSPDPLPTDNEPLDTPLDEEFRVGTLGLAWDSDDNTVLIEAVAAGAEGELPTEEDDEPAGSDLDDETRDLLRVRLGPRQVRAFIERARRVVSAGRPPCPLCGLPLDPDGHLCPRQNGYHRMVPSGE
ncbi:DUF3090 domain-containing protein [Actinocatenispora comari]|jgi:uncharacterized repeat protein (TIGR03847 family)|uniref:DUF3090 domain-containing protein n=1 Tax=Actinocatenispora comari TaxID=2807577 RepID=A0A8J4EN20_9ACTN|nr:DUF3090 domain-containing protein [Actinocatenispora comari]GIL30171.1 hypothetical protein NUM_54250 [Actinocatenispora comari]